MLESGTFDIRNLRPKDAEISYFCVPEKKEYRIEFIKELIEVKNNELEVIGFDNQELDDILSYLCVSWGCLLIGYPPFLSIKVFESIICIWQ